MHMSYYEKSRSVAQGDFSSTTYHPRSQRERATYMAGKGTMELATASRTVRRDKLSGGPKLRRMAQPVPPSTQNPNRQLRSSRRSYKGAYAHRQPNAERTNVRVNVTLPDTK